MIYGLYLSATGVIANSHKQDVVANNLANAETAGFKRDLPTFKQRLTEAEQRRTAGGPKSWSDATLEGLGGGLFVAPSRSDLSQGSFEQTGAPLDVAIEGKGFFAVQKANGSAATGDPALLTRNGQFMLDREGYLTLANEAGHRVLDADRQPIKLDTGSTAKLAVARDGTLSNDGKPLARIGVFNVADPGKLTKAGGTIMGYADAGGLTKSDATVRGGFAERSNVDPTVELTELMRTQRLLEANANIIRTQDQTLAKLVNEVGKIS
ncbi:MAG TPA: flagellar hook-basal body protein [Humisphaera sp.]